MENRSETQMPGFLERIRNPRLHAKIMKAEETIPFFKDGMFLGFSGFVEGHPKMVPAALADHVEKNGLAGKMRFTCLTGASVGMNLDDRWAALGMIEKRWPFQITTVLRKGINSGDIKFGDAHVARFAQDIANGFYTLDNDGKLDLAIVEASAITETGGIVPTLCGGSFAEVISNAKKVIVEINTTIPSFEGVHDFLPVELPPNRKPIPIVRVDDRVGTTYVPCDPDKIVAIIESTTRPIGRPLAPPDEKSVTTAAHLIDFLEFEVKQGRLPKNLLPLQSGAGSIANAVFLGLAESSFKNLTSWTEVIQDGYLDAIEAGKIDYITCTGLALTDDGLRRFFGDRENLLKKIILRQSSVSNHPEMISRLGLICMNTPVEFDIYSHVNSSIAGGSRMINGIGGSGDFMRNAHLSIMHTPSTMPTKIDPNGISCVVPMVSHVDHTEHDMSVLVTEQGLADLRGLVPKERALRIIDKCVHPEYKPILQEYFDRALSECKAKGSAHQPHMLYKVFNMHKNLEEKGTMKIENWD